MLTVNHMAKPTICGNCGAELVSVPGYGERYDALDRVWTGFLDCPTCHAVYVYARKGDPPAPQLKLEL